MPASQTNFVGGKVREIRKRRNLTQVELAKRIGVSQSDLCRMERGEYKVSLDVLFRILEVFHMQISDFFGEKRVQPATPADQEFYQTYLSLSPEAKQAVREFARFKTLQESEAESRGDVEMEGHGE